MTAIELGLGLYSKHIEDAWVAKGISMQMILEDGPMIFKTARKGHIDVGYDKTDRLLVALCNRYKEGLWEGEFDLEDRRRWYDIFTDEERSFVRHVGQRSYGRKRMREAGLLDVKMKYYNT